MDVEFDHEASYDHLQQIIQPGQLTDQFRHRRFVETLTHAGLEELHFGHACILKLLAIPRRNVVVASGGEGLVMKSLTADFRVGPSSLRMKMKPNTNLTQDVFVTGTCLELSNGEVF